MNIAIRLVRTVSIGREHVEIFAHSLALLFAVRGSQVMLGLIAHSASLALFDHSCDVKAGKLERSASDNMSWEVCVDRYGGSFANQC